MFFRKFFTKDFHYYAEKGEQFFGEERYADARHAFQDALLKIDSVADGRVDAEAAIKQRISDTGFRLGLMNLSEAEHAVGLGEFSKAEEHLRLVLELTVDPATREKAERLMGSLTQATAPAEAPHSHHNCSGCSPEPGAASEHDHLSDDHLTAQERFDLFTQTLPADLPNRYASLGKEFAEGYLLIHDGDDQAGAKIFRELLKKEENDILLYEIALIAFREGNPAECEKLLRRALAVNDMNPLCCLGVVQLLVDTGRPAEAIPLLNYMVDRQLLLDQALIFLGDIHQLLGHSDEAKEVYGKALEHPGAAKAAAERLVPLLQKDGREEEAAYLFKRYLKGCC